MKTIVSLLSCSLLLTALGGCALPPPNWHWAHPQKLDATQRERDLADCLYYASITDPRSFGRDRPVLVQEWDEPVRECMTKRGWIYVAAPPPP